MSAESDGDVVGAVGIHTGVINHGEVAAEPFIEALARYLESLRATGREGWARVLAERHPRECGWERTSLRLVTGRIVGAAECGNGGRGCGAS